jgi:glutamate/aspartate transport system substrate-binding protein
MSIRLATTIVTAALLAAAIPVSADEADSPILKRIKDRGVINMGHREASVPFAYIGDDGKVQGYSIDLCNKFVEKIKETLEMPNIKVKHVPVTSQTRLALIANGTIDMECGSTTNNLTRQKQVDYLPVTFITGTKLGSKKDSGIKEIEDLDGKAIALAQGTTNEKAIKQVMKEKGLNIKIVPVKDHPQGWLALETDRVDAYATDDVLLYGLISKAKNPDGFQVTGRFLSYDPYGLMVPRNDSTYRRLGTVLLADMMRSGEMLEIYDKWFNPGPTNINMPASATLQKAFEIQALPH